MTLITKNNSIYANYNGEVMDIYALEGSNGNKQIFYTQLTSDDIKNMIASPSKEQRLEERLTSDFNCDYNFKKPSKRHINQYPKTLLNSIKMSEMISPQIKKTQSKKKQSKKKPQKIKKPKKTKSRSRKSKNDTKRIVYTPYKKPSVTKKRKIYLTPRSNDKLMKLNQENVEIPSIEKTIF